MEEHPFITLLGLKITEPVTMLTDFILAAACLYFAIIIRKCLKSTKAKKYFVYYFFSMAAGTFLGGLFGHGLQAYIGMEGKYPGWVLTILSMYFLQIASMFLVPDLDQKYKDKYKLFSITLMIVFLFIAFYKNHFSYVVYHNMVAGLLIIPTFAYLFFKHKMLGTGWILFSFLISLSIPYFQLNRIGVNRWFTYHDVCHTIMLIGLSLIFYGAWLLHKTKNNEELLKA